jgi:hypothetical protein
MGTHGGHPYPLMPSQQEFQLEIIKPIYSETLKLQCILYIQFNMVGHLPSANNSIKLQCQHIVRGSLWNIPMRALC